MPPRVNSLQFQSFLEHHFTEQAHEHVGRRFLDLYFPGHQDPDVTEEPNHAVVLKHIQDRYVEQYA